MRIENNRAIQFYQRTKAVTSVKKEGKSSTAAAGKTDLVSISPEAVRQYELGSAAQSIAHEVESGVSSARLEQLSAQIEAGQYRISTDSLVNSILGGLEK